MATYKRIASDGKPIEVTDTPAGLSKNSGVKNSIKQPVMRRDLERAGTEIYVLPQYKLTYDENGGKAGGAEQVSRAGGNSGRS